MLRSFRNRALKALWTKGDGSKVQPALRDRVTARLRALDAATVPADLNVPGFNFHALRGKPPRHTVHVNGPWCITFGWEGQDAVDVDLENYH